MNTPLVSVVTPVHNAEPYLAECIESVLRQTYPNWHYVVVNNCSTDGSLEIANRYARDDSRIRVLNNTSFVGSIENHNIAVAQTSPDSKYCKVVSADDWLFPECLTRMVELAEESPSVAIVGSYQLSGPGPKWQVKWDEIAYPSRVVPGREFCRDHLLNRYYACGTPTSNLYRADLIRAHDWFFPHTLPHADASAFYVHLRQNDFGFVHQVLSFERVHALSVSAQCHTIGAQTAAALRDLITYGPIYLTEAEFAGRLEEVLNEYYRFLGESFFRRRTREFWEFHRGTLAEMGYRFRGLRFARAVIARFLELVLNPKYMAGRIRARVESETVASRPVCDPSLTSWQPDHKSHIGQREKPESRCRVNTGDELSKPPLHTTDRI